MKRQTRKFRMLQTNIFTKTKTSRNCFGLFLSKEYINRHVYCKEAFKYNPIQDILNCIQNIIHKLVKLFLHVLSDLILN